MKIPKAVEEAIETFDKAAQAWGWEADQGVTNVEKARAAYEADKAALLDAIRRALTNTRRRAR